MATAATFHDDAADGIDALSGDLEDLAGLEADDFADIDDDTMEALAEDAIDELDTDELDEGGIDALAGIEEDVVDEYSVDAAACEDCDELEDFGELGSFGYSPHSHLYEPRGPMLIHGPAAMALASRLNPFVLEQMDADDADAFFKGLGRAFGGIARGISGAVSQVARAAPGLLKAAGPLISRAVPMIQQVAGKLGPWGALVSAGLGAAKGLAEGKGLGGALQGALGGAMAGIPGVGSVRGRPGGAGGWLGGGGGVRGGGGGGGGGPLASILGAVGGSKGGLASVLGALSPSGGAQGGLGGLLGGLFGGGDGADDDADLDALADLTDARRIAPVIALPVGAGLAARAVARKGCAAAARIPGRNPALWRPAKQAERILLRAASKARGSAGRRLRIMRAIARLAVHILRRRAGNPRQIPRTVRWAANRILLLAGGAPAVGQVAPGVAARKLAARQQILRKVPVAALCRGAARAAA